MLDSNKGRWSTIRDALVTGRGRISAPLVWRDRILAFVCWGVLLISTAYVWASSTLGKPIFWFASGEWQQLGLVDVATSVGLVGLMVSPLAVILGARHSASRRVLTGLVNVFQTRYVFIVLLAAVAAAELGLLGPGGANGVVTQATLTGASALLLLWFFFRRETLKLEWGVLTIAWVLALTLAASSLQLTQGHIDFQSASWRARSFVVFFAACLLILSLTPPALLFLPVRRLATVALTRIVQVPLVVYLGLLASLCAVFAYLQLTGGNDYTLGLVARLVEIPLLGCVGGLGVKLLSSGHGPSSSLRQTLSGWLYAAGLVALLALYLGLAVPIAIHRLYTLSPDTVDYLLIARKYAMGDLVVRGYWSPLISWLLAPVIALGGNPQVCLRVLGGLAGVLWILLTDRLAARAGLLRPARLALDLSMVFVTVTVAFETSTPDLLGAVFVLMYLYWVSHPRLLDFPAWAGLLVGVSGGLAYYGKYYNILFVVIHLAFSGALLVFQKRPIRKVLSTFAFGFLVLAVAVAPWVVAIHARYGRFTISTSAAINRALVSPNWTGIVTALTDQPSDILVPSEDPQPAAYPGYAWSPFSSLDSFRYQIQVTFRDLLGWIDTMSQGLGPLPLLGILIAAASLFTARLEREQQLRRIWLLGSVTAYISGYMLTWSGTFRFYYAIVPLMLISLYLVVQDAVGSALSILGVRRRAVTGSLAAILLLTPIAGVGRLGSLSTQLAAPQNPCMADGSRAIEDLLVEPIAGLEKSNSELAYYTWKRTLGFLPWNMPAPDVDSTLKAMHVRTFVIPANSDKVETLTQRYGYTLVAQPRLCYRFFAVLRVPQN